MRRFHRFAAEQFERRRGVATNWVFAARHWACGDDRAKSLGATCNYALALTTDIAIARPNGLRVKLSQRCPNTPVLMSESRLPLCSQGITMRC